MKNVLGLMVSESICSSKVAEIFWFCGTQVAPATRLTAITYGAEVSVVGRAVNEKSKGVASGVPLESLAPTVIVAVYITLGARAWEWVEPPILLGIQTRSAGGIHSGASGAPPARRVPTSA